MTKLNDGGTAFPSNKPSEWNLNNQIVDWEQIPGMSLRDYFAGQALIGRLSAGCNEDGDGDGFEAKICYQMADAMLKAREEPNDKD